MSIAMIFATSLSVGYIAERALGAGWRGACATGHADACTLAATMPGGENAGRLLLAVLDVKHHNNRAEVDHRVEVAEIVGDCDYAMRPLEQAQLWDDLLAMARRCNSPVEEQLALAELGRFAEAIWFTPRDPKVPRLQLLILAHEWTAAADELDRTSHSSRGKHRDSHCRSNVLRAWGGDAGAERTLRQGPEPTSDRAEPQYVMSGSGGLYRDPNPCQREADLLVDEVDPWWAFGTGYSEQRIGEVYATFAALDDDPVALWGSRFWTSHFAKLYGTETPETLAVVDARAIHRAMAGDLDGAYHDALENDALARRVHDVELRAPLASQLLLYTQATDIPHTLPVESEAHDAWWHQLAHVFLRDGLPYAEQLDRETRNALDVAQLTGNGGPLASRLPTDRELRDLDLLAVLPRVTLHRAELVDAIRWMVPSSDPLGVRGFPFVTAVRAFTRRTVLELCGDRAAAARWSEIFGRFDRALDDRRTLAALALATAT
jgi:hypothetical protein